MIHARQIKAARALLDWSQDDLAIATGLSASTIGNIESGRMSPRDATARAIRQALESAGLEFQPEGVRVRSDEVRILQGPNAVEELAEDMLQTFHQRGGDVAMVFRTEALFGQFADGAGDAFDLLCQSTAVKVITVATAAPLLSSMAAAVRLAPLATLGPVSFVSYGTKHAVVVPDAASPKFVMFGLFALARSYRDHFDALWNLAVPLGAALAEVKKRSIT